MRISKMLKEGLIMFDLSMSFKIKHVRDVVYLG